ncbi:MAG TPA: CHASE4 domain-containing protein, partial [Woeseiaceae bacterium]|nr:CHASE4 domain-containing protein [Woeseiaceae bacterium]
MTARTVSLSLQQKMFVTLLTVMAVLVLLSWMILHRTVVPAFEKLELAAAHTNMIRVQRAIQEDLAQLSAIAGDWAPWDDAYAFVQGRYPGFVKSNLDRPTLANLDLDLLVIYDLAGNMLWGELIRDGTLADPGVLGVFEPGNPVLERLVSHRALDSRVDGLLSTASGPMLVSSQPIITSSKRGPIAGTMIMGQFFDAGRVQALRARTEVALDWFSPGGASPLESALQAEVVAAGPESVRYVKGDETIDAYSVLNDLSGEPLMILRASTPTETSALGGRAVKGALLSLSIAGVIVALVMWWLLRHMIARPLQRLANHITGIRRSGDLSVRLNDTRTDEIGALAAEFDRMTKDLHDARRQLLEQSFKAGKADTAAEVLHNIRNAMTPLINGIDRVSRSLGAGSLRVGQALDELADPECPAARREKLLAYVASAFGHLQSAREGAQEDLQTASRQAHQVEAILSDQERYANVAPVMENLHLDEVVEEAALVLPERDEGGVRLNLQRELGQYRVRAHRVGLAQVLGNLILNAYEAIQRNDPASGSIEVLADLEQRDDRPMVRVTVRDSGCGFSEDIRQRIFQRGFTSKKPSEFAGLGLHWCANSLAAMGGRILAESTGSGHGAEFHV